MGKQRNLPLEVNGRRSVAGEGNREGGRRGVHGTKVAGETRKKEPEEHGTASLGRKVMA